MLKKTEVYKLFDDLSVEPDTTILSAAYGVRDSIPFRVEEWSWDGIHGKTIVLHSDHCPALVITEEDLKKKFDVEGSTTFRKTGQYYFLNYDFSI